MKVKDIEFFKDFLEVTYKGRKFYAGDGPFPEEGDVFRAELIPFDAEAVFTQQGCGVPLYEAVWNMPDTSFGRLLAGGTILTYMCEHEPEHVSDVSHETCVYGSKYGNLWRYEP